MDLIKLSKESVQQCFKVTMEKRNSASKYRSFIEYVFLFFLFSCRFSCSHFHKKITPVGEQLNFRSGESTAC